jgi:hypothetical protein
MIKIFLVESTCRPRIRSRVVRIAYLKCAIVVIALMAAACIEAGTIPLQISFAELIRHPKRYNGKRVSVRAYLVTSCAHCRDLWANAQAPTDPRKREEMTHNTVVFGDLARGVTLPKPFSDRLKSQDYDGYVRVTGTFQYTYVSRQTEASGFGWDRLGDKQITDITQLRPLSP